MALIGIGALKLDPLYVDLAVNETTFCRKTTHQKEAVLKKFYQQKVRAEDVAPASANDDLSSSVALLFMSPQESSIICVPFSVLNAIFNKAGLLISRGEEAIVATSGANTNPLRLVENKSAPA